MVKNLPANAGDVADTGLILGSGRSPGEENGYQYSCLENSMGTGAWQAIYIWSHKELNTTEVT